ncbi:MAG: magnesium transporter [Verrucomicrobiota bacterium]
MRDWTAIREALDSSDEDRVRGLAEDLHPADAAALFSSLDDAQREKFGHFMGNDALVLTTTFLAPESAAALVEDLTERDRKHVLNDLPDDVLADVLQELEPDDRETSFLDLTDAKKDVAKDLLQYGEETAGGRMTTAMATIREDMTLRQAIEALSEKKEETEILARIFVVDDHNRVIGKVRLRDLTFNSRSILVKDIMDDEQLSIRADADQEDAVKMMTKYDMLALPVVNNQDQILGVITFDDALDIQEQESTEDIEKMGAVGGTRDEDGYLRSSVLAHLRRRLFWILGLGLVGILSGVVLYNYEDVLAGTFLLAIYLPMVVATGGNTGAQSATMVIRAMSLGEFSPNQFLPVLWKELRIGLLLGGLVGVLVGIISFLALQYVVVPAGWVELPVSLGLSQFVFIVALALTVQVTTSTTTGAALPMIARSLNLDPAVVASPAITTIVDILGLIIYFTIAQQFIVL